jgi:chemotaxis protein methyltransferase CheR
MLSGQSGQAKDGYRLLVDAEYVLTAEDFRQIAEAVHADAGIHITESKHSLVYSRLAKRLRALQLESFREYCELLRSNDGADERQKMIAALTTNVTKFYREPHHFDHLKNRVLPPLIQSARRGGRVRIWSAGCSNGQEPYSIALVILSLMPDAAKYDVKVLATDIDPNMIADSRAGIYSEDAVSAVPRDQLLRWFTPSVERGVKSWAVGDELREIATFRELNLMNAWPMKGRFDAIFCRNVVIYFKDETKTRIWSRFVPLLNPGGCLYVGHSERLSEPVASQFMSEGTTTYRLRDGGHR